MRSAFQLAGAAVLLAVVPADILVGVGVEAGTEVEFFRWASMFLFGQAVLVAKMTRNGIVDDRWHRVVGAGHAALLLGAVYFATGNPFFLLLSFCLLVAIMLRTWMPVLDHWSSGAEARWDRSR